MESEIDLRTRQREERRERILDAARTLFIKQGYSGATIKEIAHLAAVSPPTVHKYYGTKQQLLLDLISAKLGEGAVPFEELGNGTSPIALVSSILEEIIEKSLKKIDRKTWTYAFTTFGNGAKDGVRQDFRSRLSTHYDVLDDVLDTLKTSGKLNAGIDIKVARRLLEMFNGSLFESLLWNEIDMTEYQRQNRQGVKFLLEMHAAN